MLTIGIAVEIPEPFGSFLRASREEFGDPLARAIPPHITLLPPTVVAGDEHVELVEHLRTMTAGFPPFDVALDGTGTFRPTSPVVFVRIGAGAESCSLLQSMVRSGPVARPLDFPYHPHVTVAHLVGDEALDKAQVQLAAYRAAFSVGSIHLYHHGDDEVWRSVEAFELRGLPS